MFRLLARRVLRVVFALLTRCEVHGMENVPAGGPLIVVSNHLGHLDPPLLLATLPWPMETLAVAGLYQVPVTGQLLRLYGAIPVQRDGYDRRALRRAWQALDEGKVVALAPEGRMSLSGALESGRPGAAYLALRSGAPLLPVGVTGTERAYDEWRLGRRPRLTVTIGPTFTLSGYESGGKARREWLERATDEIMRRIADLLPEAYRGVYR